MSLNRIQKLLYSEYSDLEDVVLIESPFAEITRKGLGLRQVQLGNRFIRFQTFSNENLSVCFFDFF